MKDALLLLLFTGLGFPLGAALALFVLWMDKQKRPPRRRPTAVIPVGIAILGIGSSMLLAVFNAVEHHWHDMNEHLMMAVFFVPATWGAWLVTRRTQIGPPDGPNYGDGI